MASNSEVKLRSFMELLELPAFCQRLESFKSENEEMTVKQLLVSLTGDEVFAVDNVLTRKSSEAQTHMFKTQDFMTLNRKDLDPIFHSVKKVVDSETFNEAAEEFRMKFSFGPVDVMDLSFSGMVNRGSVSVDLFIAYVLEKSASKIGNLVGGGGAVPKPSSELITQGAVNEVLSNARDPQKKSLFSKVFSYAFGEVDPAIPGIKKLLEPFVAPIPCGSFVDTRIADLSPGDKGILYEFLKEVADTYKKE